MTIEIKYDGEYPNLCSGKLIVIIDGNYWAFPDHCLSSGGNVSFDDDWNEKITQGPWTVSEWPYGFQDHLKSDVVDAINANIPFGCCGGCV